MRRSATPPGAPSSKAWRAGKAVGELAAELPVSRPAVSQHLRVLKEAGLVTDRADGTRRIYQIHQQGVQAIHGYLDQMWGQAMTAFQAEARQVASQAPAGSPAPELPASPRSGAAWPGTRPGQLTAGTATAAAAGQTRATPAISNRKR